MGMRIVWGLYDRDAIGDKLVALFENEPLLTQYRDYQLMRPYYDELVAHPGDYLPTGDMYEEEFKKLYDEAVAQRERLLDIGYERWFIDELNSPEPRYYTKKHELWNSVPPNRNRLIIHFDAG
jgi:hypothetical protein